MRFNRSVRLAVCAAMAGSAALAVVLPAATAGAKTKPATAVCTGFSGNSTAQTLSGCTGAPASSGNSVPNSTNTQATITWTGTGLTSVEAFSYKIKSGKADHCTAPGGSSNTAEVQEKGSVIGGSATSLIGGKVKSKVCVFTNNTTKAISLAVFPGTTVSL